MNNTKINNINIGNCGEYYVAAELERRGFTVAVLMSNVDNFDILAINKMPPYNQYAIQVKTTTKKNWVLGKKNETLKGANIFYVFVKLENDKMPEYYICPSEYVADAIHSHHIQWLQTPGRNGQPHNDNDLREFFADSAYKDKWDYFK